MDQDIYYSVLKAGEKYYSVQFKFNVSEKYRTDSYKDHKITEIKTTPLLYHGSKSAHAITGAVHNFSINELTGGVKPVSSKVLDENGLAKGQSWSIGGEQNELRQYTKLILSNYKNVNTENKNEALEKNPTTLACVLNKKILQKTDGKEEVCPIVAFIKPSNILKSNSVVLSAFPKKDFERFLKTNIEKNRLLYLKDEKALRRDYPKIQVYNVATVPFIEPSLKGNIQNFIESVNIEIVNNNGMDLRFIPNSEKTLKVCNAAKRNSIESILFFPEKMYSNNLFVEVFESLNKTAIQNIPNYYFINSLKLFLETTNKFNKQEKIAYTTINKRLSENQKKLLKKQILNEYEIFDDEIELTETDFIQKFKEWQSPVSYQIESDINPINNSNQIFSFEKNNKQNNNQKTNKGCHPPKISGCYT